MADRFQGAFDDTKRLIYDLFDSRHTRRQIWYEHLVEIGIGLYLVGVTFFLDMVAIPFRMIYGPIKEEQKALGDRIGAPLYNWFQRQKEATYDRQLYGGGSHLWLWIFIGIGAVILGLAIWYMLHILGGVSK